MRIFKYTTAENALKLLKTRKIKVSAADELNDPFELSPLFDIEDYTLESCIQFLRRPDQITYWYAKEGNARGFSDLTAYEGFYLEETKLRQRAESLMQKVPQNVERARQNFANTFSRNFRLFCASENRDSILMWSHYAEDHKGVAIEFDTHNRPYSHLPDYLLTVKYSPSKVPFRYDGNCDENQMQKQLFAVAGTKSPHWEYEQEVRFIVPLKLCVDSQFVLLDDLTVIRSITFGCRHMKDGLTETLSGILGELDSEHFKHVGIWDANAARHTFALEFVQRRSEI